MKISSGGVGTVASGAVASAGSNSGGKRYIWAWDFSQISEASRANTFFANTGWHDGPDAQDGTDLPPEYGFGVSYSTSYAHQHQQCHAEGLFIQTTSNWSSGRGGSSGPSLTAWLYNQFNRDDGQPHKMSGKIEDYTFSSGKYFHLILKTKGDGSPIAGQQDGGAPLGAGDRVTGRGKQTAFVRNNMAIGDIITLNADLANGTSAGIGNELGSGIGWVTTAETGNPNKNPDLGTNRYDGKTYKELVGSDSLLGAFQLAYSDNRYDVDMGTEVNYFNATETFVSGDYRTIIWDLAEAGVEVNPKTLDFKLFNDGDSTTDNPHHYGSANVSFIVCGMVLSNERLTDIPLPIDIHRT